MDIVAGAVEQAKQELGARKEKVQALQLPPGIAAEAAAAHLPGETLQPGAAAARAAAIAKQQEFTSELTQARLTSGRPPSLFQPSDTLSLTAAARARKADSAQQVWAGDVDSQGDQDPPPQLGPFQARGLAAATASFEAKRAQQRTQMQSQMRATPVSRQPPPKPGTGQGSYTANTPTLIHVPPGYTPASNTSAYAPLPANGSGTGPHPPAQTLPTPAGQVSTAAPSNTTYSHTPLPTQSQGGYIDPFAAAANQTTQQTNPLWPMGGVGGTSGLPSYPSTYNQPQQQRTGKAAFRPPLSTASAQTLATTTSSQGVAASGSSIGSGGLTLTPAPVLPANQAPVWPPA